MEERKRVPGGQVVVVVELLLLPLLVMMVVVVMASFGSPPLPLSIARADSVRPSELLAAASSIELTYWLPGRQSNWDIRLDRQLWVSEQAGRRERLFKVKG